MKKTFALLLAALMLAVPLGLSAFAADPVTDHLVGTKGEGTPGGIDNGVGEESFPNPNPSNSQNVDVIVQTLTHKYAVDITYTDAGYKLPGLTWNVDELRYDDTDGVLDTTVDVTVTNYSDLPVWVTMAVTDQAADDALGFAFEDAEGSSVSAAPIQLDAVDVDAAVPEAVDLALTGKLVGSGADGALTDADILKAVTYYTEGAGKASVSGNKVTVATYTVTVSKSSS